MEPASTLQRSRKNGKGEACAISCKPDYIEEAKVVKGKIRQDFTMSLVKMGSRERPGRHKHLTTKYPKSYTTMARENLVGGFSCGGLPLVHQWT
jgi:MinD superfamily P-loop ATPase